MSQPAPISDQERADLVAYLDGELTGEAARALEAKLSLHPAARAEAEALRRTWDLLDYLPRPQPSATFTHRTLQRLTPVRNRELRRRKRWFRVLWLASVLLAGWAGYAGYNVFAPKPSRENEPIQPPRVLETRRERDWIERLPKRVQDDLAKLPPQEREAQLKLLREQERQQQILWKRPISAPQRTK